MSRNVPVKNVGISMCFYAILHYTSLHSFCCGNVGRTESKWLLNILWFQRQNPNFPLQY